MACLLCAWICNRLGGPDSGSPVVWRAADRWEDDFAVKWEPAEADAALRQRWSEADSLLDEDPAASLAIHRELAEGGSAYSMLKLAWHYDSRTGTERNPAVAEEYYRQALCAGSWRATIGYAHRLFERGAHDEWPRTLSDGVQEGFIPACYWLAWYTYERSPKARTAREVRPLLEAAAAAGHPGARLILARWAASGKFGWREVRRGFRMLREIAGSVMEGEYATEPAAADDRAPAPAILAATGA